MSPYFAHIDAAGRVLGFYVGGLHSSIPDGAIPISAEMHAAWIADTAHQRWDAESAALAPCAPPPPPPPTADQVRAWRDRLLAQCDWTVLPDAPLTDGPRAAWIAYRQALRDVPAQDGFPSAVDWPEAPVSTD